MLSVAFIRENKDLVLERLTIRNFENAEKIINKVIDKDVLRRSTQAELDNTLSESNKLSKEIGILYKSGEVQKANIVKEKTSQLKEATKSLSEKLSSLESELKELLYEIPNIPTKLFPKGNS